MSSPLIASESKVLMREQSLPAETVCDLCGLPVRQKGHSEKSLHFCCPGCQQVYTILSGNTGALPSDFRNTDIFRACMATGIIPSGKMPTEDFVRTQTDTQISPLTVDLHVDGMWCPACAWLITEILKKTEGIIGSQVSFFSDSARIQYLPHKTSPAEIAAGIDRIGYRTHTVDADSIRGAKRDDSLIRLGVASVLTINVMMLAYSLDAGFVRTLTPAVIAYFSYPMFALTIPVVFYAGMPVLRKAFMGVRYAVVSMDTLISVSALSAFFYSFVRMVQGSIHTYFDTTAMLVTIVLFGRYIETRAHRRIVAGAVFDQTSLAKVHVCTQESEHWVTASAVVPGDHFVVKEGEHVPLDGRIESGECIVDQSAITGESWPVPRSPGDHVMAGSVMLEGNIKVIATKTHEESIINRMGIAVREALEHKNPEEELSDRLSRIFVPAVLSIAIATGVVLWLSGSAMDTVLLRGLTVLLISCPCTLGIAIPLVKTISTGLSKKLGILTTNPEALLKIRKIDVMVLDKTGTVTEGNMTLQHVLSDGTSEKEILQLIACIESQSKHFLAREVMRRAQELKIVVEKPEAMEEFESMGVCGLVHRKHVFAGNRRLLSRLDIPISKSIDLKASQHEKEGMTVVFFGWDGKVNGILTFGDPIKHNAHTFISWLQEKGIAILLVSGDTGTTTKAVAASLGVRETFGEMLPGQKAQLVKDLQSKGHIVGMAGDGINDAAALAQSDVAIAVAPDYEITYEASDFIILSGQLDAIKNIFQLALWSRRITRQNLAFSFVYNILAIPLAATGLLNPLIAVTVMFASSLTVIGNGFRLRRQLKFNTLLTSQQSPERGL